MKKYEQFIYESTMEYLGILPESEVKKLSKNTCDIKYHHSETHSGKIVKYFEVTRTTNDEYEVSNKKLKDVNQTNKDLYNDEYF